MSTPNQDVQQRLALLREIELVNARILDMNRAAATASGQYRRDLEDRIAQHETILQMNRDQLAVLNSLKKLTKENLTNFDSIDDTLSSIGNTLQNNTALQNTFNTKLNSAKNTLTSVANIIEASTFDDRQLKHIDAAGKGYANMNTSIASAASNLQNGRISQQKYNDILQQSFEHFDSLVDVIDTSTQSGQDLMEVFRQGRAEMESFERAAQRSAVALGTMNTALDQMGGSGVEGIRELGDVLKSATNGGKGLALAMGTLAGVAAGMAYNFGLIGNKLGTIAGYDKDIAGLTGEIDIINQKVSMGMEGFGARNFVMEEAMLQFSTSAQQMAAGFRAASKTALFGNKLGSVGYGGAQLQMAGISAENIAESMKAASDATGRMPSGKVAADMSIMAQRTGQSTESIAIINETFQRLDNVSEKTALNLQEGVRAMADKAGVNLGSAMAEIAEASKDTLSYQIKGSSQLAKQVIAAKSLGVSFNEVAKAGQNMVLNYKDSIKSEMSLSAMLGKNVNLSEVRAKFMSGDTEGAMNALKAQGLNPKDMNMFQQQALQQALGGMDLNSIQKISENTAKSGGNLKEGSAGSGNKEYLQRVQERESSLAGANAMIAAAAELESIKLRSEAEMQKQEAIIKNVGDIATLMNERDQQGFLKNAETMLTTALISTVATVVTSFLMSKGAGLFSKLIPAASAAPAAAAASAAPAAGVVGMGGILGKAGKVAKFGGRLLGKVAAPLAIAMSIYDGYKGFTADADASTGQKFKNAGSSILSGLTFGLLGKNSDEIKATATKPVSTVSAIKPVVEGSKPTVKAVNDMGQKQVDAQKMIAEKAKITLTEAQYQNKLQQEMVAMLGIANQFLNKIMINTADGGDTTIDGEVLNKKLLNNARRKYAVGR
jgi:hypothetical protein